MRRPPGAARAPTVREEHGRCFIATSPGDKAPRSTRGTRLHDRLRDGGEDRCGAVRICDELLSDQRHHLDAREGVDPEALHRPRDEPADRLRQRRRLTCCAARCRFAGVADQSRRHRADGGGCSLELDANQSAGDRPITTPMVSAARAAGTPEPRTHEPIDPLQRRLRLDRDRRGPEQSSRSPTSTGSRNAQIRRVVRRRRLVRGDGRAGRRCAGAYPSLIADGASRAISYYDAANGTTCASRSVRPPGYGPPRRSSGAGDVGGYVARRRPLVRRVRRRLP